MAPSREALLRTRVTTIAAYAADVHRELKMSKARSLALYGSAIVPVPVPLRPNETLPEYEARFHAWLFSERNRTVDVIRANANVERSCRFAFARAEARAHWAAGSVKGEDGDVKDEDMVKMEPGLDGGGATERTVVCVGVKRERSAYSDGGGDDEDSGDDGADALLSQKRVRAETWDGASPVASPATLASSANGLSVRGSSAAGSPDATETLALAPPTASPCDALDIGLL